MIDPVVPVVVVPVVPWHEVFSQSPVPLLYIDCEGRHVGSNDAFGELVGYSLDERGRLNVLDITRPVDRRWTRWYLGRLMRGESEEYETVKQFVRKDGSELSVTARVRAICDESNTRVGLLCSFQPSDTRAYVDDVSLRRLLAQSDATVTVLDSHGRVLETTGRYQTVLGYPAEFWENRYIFDLAAPGQEDVCNAFREEVRTTHGERCSIELQLVDAHGRLHDMRIHAVNLLQDFEVAGIVLTMVNITEERRLFEGLRQRTATAEAVIQAQTMLLATVSHELRNPLHALSGVAELLSLESLGERAERLSQELVTQLAGLSDLTQDLLDAAQASAGTVVLRPSVMNLHDLVQEVVRYGQTMTGSKGEIVGVAAAFQPGVPEWIFADPVRVRQILRNLVGNAVKFTDIGQVQINVKLAATVSPATAGVRIEVTDSGSGVSVEDLQRIRQPFVTGAMAGPAGGAGLGLSIVQRTAEAMEGELSIVSVEGTGSTFAVTLPLVVVDAPVNGGVRTASAGEDVRLIGLNVLVVEDNAVNQELAKVQLTRLGMHPYIVGSGEEAISFCAAGVHPIDVILMDFRLPGINGIEATSRLRGLSVRLANTPAICLTGSASAADLARFTAHNMTCIQKPASLAAIRDGILQGITRMIPPLPDGVSLVRSVVKQQLARLSDDLGGDEVVKSLVETFLQESPDRLRTISNGRLGNPEVRRSAHSLKSSARLFGGVAVGHMCEQFELGIEVDRDDFREQTDQLVSVLEDWVSVDHRIAVCDGSATGKVVG
jgi:PAS domain S-box-containing protein